MKTVFLIYGLPGSGKSTMASKLQEATNHPWYNADRVRKSLSSDLGFSINDRLEQSRRMASLAALSLEQPNTTGVIVDFVCPTIETYVMFLRTIADYSNGTKPKVITVFMNTIDPNKSRFADTSSMADYFTLNRSPSLIFNLFMLKEAHWNTAVSTILGASLSLVQI